MTKKLHSYHEIEMDPSIKWSVLPRLPRPLSEFGHAEAQADPISSSYTMCQRMASNFPEEFAVVVTSSEAARCEEGVV